MKSLLDIYWNIYSEWYEKSISFADEMTKLHHAAEEYVEGLLKHNDRWKSIVLHDIDFLKSSSIGRSRLGQVGYKEGAETFLLFIYQELDRYGLKFDDAESQAIQETAMTDIIPETDKKRNVSNEKNTMSKTDIMMSVKNEPFKPKKDGKPIPYQKCFERLTEGSIRRSAGQSEPVEVVGKQYDLELFKYCVDCADIKKIIVEGKKCYAYLFLRCISEYYENPSEYRKAAAKSFGIKTICSVGGDTKNDFFTLFSGIFKNEDIPRKKRR